MPATQPRALLQSTFIPAVETTLVPAETGTVLQIDKCTLCNTGASTRTVTLKVVQSGGSAATVNNVLQARSLLAGETYLCPEMVGQYLNPGDFISGLASVAGEVSIRISGRRTST